MNTHFFANRPAQSPMQTKRTAVLVAVALASSFMATAAFASGSAQTATTDNGYVDHFQSNKTRAQVQKDAAAALKMINNAYPMTVHDGKQPGAHRGEHAQGLTREQVNTQYLNESPAQRKMRDDLFRG